MVVYDNNEKRRTGKENDVGKSSLRLVRSASTLDVLFEVYGFDSYQSSPLVLFLCLAIRGKK